MGPIASCRPGGPPSFHSLATGMIPLLEAQMSETDRLLEVQKVGRGPSAKATSGSTTVQTACPGERKLMLLACFWSVDQFEELYTLVEAPEDPDAGFLERPPSRIG